MSRSHTKFRIILCIVLYYIIVTSSTDKKYQHLHIRKFRISWSNQYSFAIQLDRVDIRRSTVTFRFQIYCLTKCKYVYFFTWYNYYSIIYIRHVAYISNFRERLNYARDKYFSQQNLVVLTSFSFFLFFFFFFLFSTRLAAFRRSMACKSRRQIYSELLRRLKLLIDRTISNATVA